MFCVPLEQSVLCVTSAECSVSTRAGCTVCHEHGVFCVPLAQCYVCHECRVFCVALAQSVSCATVSECSECKQYFCVHEATKSQGFVVHIQLLYLS